MPRIVLLLIGYCGFIEFYACHHRLAALKNKADALIRECKSAPYQSFESIIAHYSVRGYLAVRYDASVKTVAASHIA
jgi:hypothetical protein